LIRLADGRAQLAVPRGRILFGGSRFYDRRDIVSTENEVWCNRPYGVS
jgi:hypothetical protein